MHALRKQDRNSKKYVMLGRTGFHQICSNLKPGRGLVPTSIFCFKAFKPLKNKPVYRKANFFMYCFLRRLDKVLSKIIILLIIHHFE